MYVWWLALYRAHLAVQLANEDAVLGKGVSILLTRHKATRGLCTRASKGSTTRVTVMHKAKVKGANHHARPSQRPQQKHTHLSLEDTLGRTVAVERHQRLLQEHSQVDGFAWRHALQCRRDPPKHHVVVADAAPKRKGVLVWGVGMNVCTHVCKCAGVQVCVGGAAARTTSRTIACA